MTAAQQDQQHGLWPHLVEDIANNHGYMFFLPGKYACSDTN